MWLRRRERESSMARLGFLCVPTEILTEFALWIGLFPAILHTSMVILSRSVVFYGENRLLHASDDFYLSISLPHSTFLSIYCSAPCCIPDPPMLHSDVLFSRCIPFCAFTTITVTPQQIQALGFAVALSVGYTHTIINRPEICNAIGVNIAKPDSTELCPPAIV